MSNFREALIDKLEAKPKRKLRAKILLRHLKGPRGQAFAGWLELHARLHYGFGQGEVDWNVVLSKALEAFFAFCVAAVPLILKMLV